MKTSYFLKIIAEYKALLTVAEAKFLYDIARGLPSKGTVIEIGSFRGGSTILLAQGIRDGQRTGVVYAVDPHKEAVLFGEREKRLTQSLEEFENNIQSAGVRGNVITVPSTSVKAALAWDKPVDVLWIDGNHDYEYVKLDFLLWEEYLVKGGRILLHDTHDSKYSSRPLGGIKSQRGPTRVAQKYILQSDRYTNIKVIDSITYAEKTKKSKSLSKVQKRYIIATFLLCNILITRPLNCIEGIFLKLDRAFGRCGSQMRKRTPRLYFFLKRGFFS